MITNKYLAFPPEGRKKEERADSYIIRRVFRGEEGATANFRVILNLKLAAR